MSINQLNIIFAVGEVSLLFLILVVALVARWAGKRENSLEITPLPAGNAKLHGREGPATYADAQFAALNSDSAGLQRVQQPDTALARERAETVSV
jgi:hypothetical protein